MRTTTMFLNLVFSAVLLTGASISTTAEPAGQPSAPTSTEGHLPVGTPKPETRTPEQIEQASRSGNLETPTTGQTATPLSTTP